MKNSPEPHVADKMKDQSSMLTVQYFLAGVDSKMNLEAKPGEFVAKRIIFRTSVGIAHCLAP